MTYGWVKRLTFISFHTLTHKHLSQSATTMAQITRIKVPATGRTIELPIGLFINNEFVPSVDSQETLRCVISE